MQRGGSTRECRRVVDADPVRQLTLERVDVRTERGDPVRVERIQEELTLSSRSYPVGKGRCAPWSSLSVVSLPVSGRHEAQLESHNEKEKAAHRQHHQCEYSSNPARHNGGDREQRGHRSVAQDCPPLGPASAQQLVVGMVAVACEE